MGNLRSKALPCFDSHSVVVVCEVHVLYATACTAWYAVRHRHKMQGVVETAQPATDHDAACSRSTESHDGTRLVPHFQIYKRLSVPASVDTRAVQLWVAACG
jgi:hypothetical protein